MIAAMSAQLSAAEARRIALASQGLLQPRPQLSASGTPAIDRAALHALVQQLGVLQLDSVNVLTRSHYLPVWSRLGAYDPEALDDLARTAPRALFEYWGHEASLLPIELQPLLRWRMARAGENAWKSVRAMSRRPALLKSILDFIGERGPISVAELELPTTKKRGSGGWWGWSEAKIALEWLFWSGQITSAGRRRFERLYDLPERVLPEPIAAAPTPTEDEAQRLLTLRAARAMGIATQADLRDYYRLPLVGARQAVASLVERGDLIPTTVEGWSKPAFLHRDAAAFTQAATEAISYSPANEPRAALLSPFDSLIWTRERTERMFGMRVRLEVYVPAPRRVHGYYVLPFLLGDRLVGRVDLKADRQNQTLLVQAAHLEETIAPSEVPAICAALATELRGLAAWQGLPSVRATRRGNLASALSKTLTASKPSKKPAAQKRPKQ
jgi:uncharacterized protein